MRESVEEYVRACNICGEANDPQRKKRHALQKYTVGARFERIGIDIAGPYPETARKNSHILVISDYFSKLVEIFPLPNIRAETVADVLFRGWIKRYGCPREIHSDQGRQFESAVFQEMCKMLEISKTRTTPLHARSDGMIERMNRTMQNMLSKYIQENQKDWDLYLDFIVMAYNTCEHESTGCSPYRILYGENIVLPIDILTDNIAEEGTVETDISGFVPQLQSNLKRIHAFVRNNLSKSAEKQKKHYDSHVKEICYNVGDLVWRNQKKTVPGVKTKITRHWTGPWIITEKLCDILFRIKHSDSSPSLIMHGDNLKKYHGPKTIILRNDDQIQRQADQPDLHTFLQVDTQRTVSYVCRVDIMADDVIKDDVSSFSAQETHIPLRSYDQIQVSQNKVFCEENLYRKSLTGAMVGIKSTRELKTFDVLLNSCESQDHNALAEQWPTEHTPECLCTDVYSRETEIILAEQRSAEQINRCINSVRANIQSAEQSAAEQKRHTVVSRAVKYCRSTCGNTYNISSRLSNHTRHVIISRQKLLFTRVHLGKMDNPKFVCDTCGKDYRHKRNLKRHVTETHQHDGLFYPCSEYLCRGRFVRRSYLVKHLQKFHGLSKLGANVKSKRVRKAEVPNCEHYYSDVTDVSDDESFFEQLDEQEALQNSAVVQDQATMQTDVIMPETEQQQSNVSLDEICAENEKQNLNLVLELCDTLGNFVTNLDLEKVCLPVEKASDMSEDVPVVNGNLTELSVHDEMATERMLSDSDVINGFMNFKTVGGLIISPSEDGLDYDDLSDSTTKFNEVTGDCDKNVDENNNVDNDSEVLKMEHNGGISSADNVQRNGENYEDSDSNDVNLDEFREMTDDDGRNEEKTVNTTVENDDIEDDVIIINSDDDDESTEYEITAINLTLQRTAKMVNGAPVSVKRSMSLGYTENVNLTGAAPKKLFELIQEEFKEFAQYYHDQMN